MARMGIFHAALSCVLTVFAGCGNWNHQSSVSENPHAAQESSGNDVAKGAKDLSTSIQESLQKRKIELGSMRDFNRLIEALPETRVLILDGSISFQNKYSESNRAAMYRMLRNELGIQKSAHFDYDSLKLPSEIRVSRESVKPNSNSNTRSALIVLPTPSERNIGSVHQMLQEHRTEDVKVVSFVRESHLREMQKLMLRGKGMPFSSWADNQLVIVIPDSLFAEGRAHKEMFLTLESAQNIKEIRVHLFGGDLDAALRIFDYVTLSQLQKADKNKKVGVSVHVGSAPLTSVQIDTATEALAQIRLDQLSREIRFYDDSGRPLSGTEIEGIAGRADARLTLLKDFSQAQRWGDSDARWNAFDGAIEAGFEKWNQTFQEALHAYTTLKELQRETRIFEPTDAPVGHYALELMKSESHRNISLSTLISLMARKSHYDSAIFEPQFASALREYGSAQKWVSARRLTFLSETKLLIKRFERLMDSPNDLEQREPGLRQFVQTQVNDARIAISALEAMDAEIFSTILLLEKLVQPASDSHIAGFFDGIRSSLNRPSLQFPIDAKERFTARLVATVAAVLHSKRDSLNPEDKAMVSYFSKLHRELVKDFGVREITASRKGATSYFETWSKYKSIGPVLESMRERAVESRGHQARLQRALRQFAKPLPKLRNR